MARELCVIFNPSAGKGRAAQRLEPARLAWRDRAAFWPTERPGHGETLARRAADEGFACVAAAGGDGTAHEVANGLLASGRSDVRFAIFPIGSANDFAYTLFRTELSGGRIDVGRASREDGRTRHFLCNFGLGFSGSVTAESRRVRWLQGTALYGWAALRALGRGFASPTMAITVDGEAARSDATLMVAVLMGEREGGFVMAPGARLDDGRFDLVRAAAMSRIEVLGLLPRLALWGAPASHPKLERRQGAHVEIVCDRPVNVHCDGEFLAVVDDGMRRFAVEVVPSALAVDVALSRRGGLPE